MPQLRVAIVEDRNGVVVERVGWLAAELDQVTRGVEYAPHAPVALARVLVRKVGPDIRGGEFAHGVSYEINGFRKAAPAKS